MRIFLILCLISVNVFAAENWSDLTAGNNYKLTQNFQLPQVERSGSLLDFSKGEKLRLKEIVPLAMPGALLTLYIFDYLNCPGPQLVTDMEIIPVNGTSPLVEVGAFVEKCELNVYLETKDYYTKSLFE